MVWTFAFFAFFGACAGFEASRFGFFCIFLSLCRFWSLGCLKPAEAQKNAKNPNLKAPKPAQAQEMQQMQNPDAMSEVRA